MMETKIEYDRKKALEEFEREYQDAYERIAKPKKWLTSGEIAVLAVFDKVVRDELAAKRESEEDILAFKCSIKAKAELEMSAIRMAVYWLMEETLSRSPHLRRWDNDEDRSLGDKITETRTGMNVEWTVDLKKYYSEEVWK